jgi:hypothetical protein
MMTNTTILRPAPPPSKATPWTIALPADALDGLYGDPPTPPLSTPRRLWMWLCNRVPCLRGWRGTGEAAKYPPVSDADRATLLAMLCDPDVREAVLALLAPGIRAIVRQVEDRP